MLMLDKVSFKIDNKTIASEMTIKVQPGEFVVLVGPNGAGKSTALKLLSGDFPPTSGSVYLHNQSLLDYTPKQLARLRAVMTQHYDMQFPFQAQEVITFANFAFDDVLNTAQQQAYVNQAIKLTNTDHLRDKIFTQLSGGEQQRVQLARVLTQITPALQSELIKTVGAPYLLIDEPTSSLDIYHQHHVMSIAQSCTKQGAGVVAVVHDLALAAAFADRIYVIGNGQIVAHGLPQQCLTSEVIEHVYAVNASLHTTIGSLPHMKVGTNNECLQVDIE